MRWCKPGACVGLEKKTIATPGAHFRKLKSQSASLSQPHAAMAPGPPVSRYTTESKRYACYRPRSQRLLQDSQEGQPDVEGRGRRTPIPLAA